MGRKKKGWGGKNWWRIFQSTRCGKLSHNSRRSITDGINGGAEIGRRRKRTHARTCIYGL